MSIHINKIEGETEPKLRRRAANELCNMLERDELLRQEVAIVLGLHPEALNYLHGGEAEQAQQFIEL